MSPWESNRNPPESSPTVISTRLPGSQVGVGVTSHLQVLFLQQTGQAFGPVLTLAHQKDLKTAAAPLFQAVGQGRHQPAGFGPGLGQLLGQVVVSFHLEGDIPVLVRVPPGQERAENLAETGPGAPPRGSGPASPGVPRPCPLPALFSSCLRIRGSHSTTTVSGGRKSHRVWGWS